MEPFGKKEGLDGNIQANKGSIFRVKFIIIQFPYVDVCAILSDDQIYDGAIKALITKEAQEWDVVDPSKLKEAAAFKRIHLLCFFYFCDSDISRQWAEWMILKGFPTKEPLGKVIDIQVKSAPASKPAER